MTMENLNHEAFAVYACDPVTGWPIRDSVHIVTVEKSGTDFEKAELFLTAYERISSGAWKEAVFQ